MFTLVIVFVVIQLTAGVTYEGYTVYTTLAKTKEEIEVLRELKDGGKIDFWSELNKVGKPVSIMVSPNEDKPFRNYMELNGLSYDVLIQNVETTIQAERKYHLAKLETNGEKIAFDQYYRYGEINDYLVQLERDYPDVVSLETIGQSYEGRDLNLIRISTGASAQKPSIFIDAGIHAREWIAPALALYIIFQLVENPENRSLIENVDWLIVPCANPDGYEYTWNQDRFWRKTRSKGKICDGADANRNFNFHWMEGGASDQECEEIYAGPQAFSEPEALAIANFLTSTENIALYLALHSYGQYLIYPWSWTYDYPDNWQELDDLGQEVNRAISAVAGTEYTVGESTEILYYAAGCSDDYAKGVANVSLVYVLELPGGGEDGFDLPPSRIRDVCVETWQGILVWHDYVKSHAG